MAKRAFTWAVLLVVLLVAALFRFYGLNWDGGVGAHPDERYIVGVAESLRWPDTLNPFAAASDYAYGHLPLYLLALTRGLARGLDSLVWGRALAALFDLGTVALTYALGRETYNERIGLLAATLVALMVLHVQQAHFYTADGALVPFVMAALLFTARAAQRRGAADLCRAGVCAGLALGTKISAVLLAVPLGAACALGPDRWRKNAWRCALAALAAFAFSNPFALLEFPTFWRSVAAQAAIARGTLDTPYTRQFHATWPYVYPITQQLRWGMGWALGLAAFGGLAYAVWRAVREAPRRTEWVLLAWSLPYFAFIGALHAKFPRYLLPLTPLLAIYAARLVADLAQWLQEAVGLVVPLLPCASAPLLLCVLLRCLAFVSSYRAPHPWQAASEWLYERAEPGAVIAVEEWDHPLPLDSSDYHVRKLPIFDRETTEKWTAMEETLAEADYVIIATKRGYAALARWPERYPHTARYYLQLFEGRLSFEPVACFGRHPRLGPLALADRATRGLEFSLPGMCRPEASVVLSLGRLDESFVVYDHPRTVIFERMSAQPQVIAGSASCGIIAHRAYLATGDRRCHQPDLSGSGSRGHRMETPGCSPSSG